MAFFYQIFFTKNGNKFLSVAFMNGNAAHFNITGCLILELLELYDVTQSCIFPFITFRKLRFKYIWDLRQVLPLHLNIDKCCTKYSVAAIMEYESVMELPKKPTVPDMICFCFLFLCHHKGRGQILLCGFCP